MGRYNPAPYSPHHPFVAVKAFTYAAVPYVHGDDFPTDGVPEHRLRQMFDARMIGPKGFGAEPPKYLENGRGKADQLAKEIAAEEGGDAARTAVPAAPRRANAAKPAPAAAKTKPAKVGAKAAPAGRRGRSAA